MILALLLACIVFRTEISRQRDDFFARKQNENLNRPE